MPKSSDTVTLYQSIDEIVVCQICHSHYNSKLPHRCTVFKDVFSDAPTIVPVAPERDRRVVVPGYESLDQVLQEALEQAQGGKGAERHGTDRPFEEQPVMIVSDMVGDGFATGQAIKKIQESMRMDDNAAIRERLGAIVYLAASIIRLKKTVDKPR